MWWFVVAGAAFFTLLTTCLCLGGGQLALEELQYWRTLDQDAKGKHGIFMTLLFGCLL